MAERSAIEWTDASWTPIRARNKATGNVGWHCVHKSHGCQHCYAESLNLRLGTGLPFKPGHEKDIEIFLDETMLLAPLRWRLPRKIFVCSMTDLFADFVTDEMIDRVFAVMALAPHTFQILTKRSARMRAYIQSRSAKDADGFAAEDVRVAMTSLAGTPSRRAMAPALKAVPLGKYCKQIAWPLPNVWLGVSAEDQPRADERIPDLLATPAAVRFVSAEPLLGAIDFQAITDRSSLAPQIGEHCFSALPDPDDEPGSPYLDWIIAGGESGPHARPMHPDWARSIRDQCGRADVPFFFKQWGEWAPSSLGPQIARASSEERVFDKTHWRSPYGDLAATDPDVMNRVGKRRAGRLLDGREHNEFPEPRR